jgi:hypothetical protein
MTTCRSLRAPASELVRAIQGWTVARLNLIPAGTLRYRCGRPRNGTRVRAPGTTGPGVRGAGSPSRRRVWNGAPKPAVEQP